MKATKFWGLRLWCVALTFVALGAPAAHGQENNFIGHWKLNIEKSKWLGKPAQSGFRIYEDRGCGVVVGTRDVITAAGTHSYDHYAVRYDGKYYPIVIRPTRTNDEIEFTSVDASTNSWSIKGDGKVSESGTSVVSKDGKTLTVTTNAPQGQGIEVYDRE